MQVHPTSLLKRARRKNQVPRILGAPRRGQATLDNAGAWFVDELKKRGYITEKMRENGKVRSFSFLLPQLLFPRCKEGCALMKAVYARNTRSASS